MLRLSNKKLVNGCASTFTFLLRNIIQLQTFRLRASRKEVVEVTGITEVSSRTGTPEDLQAYESKVSEKGSYMNHNHDNTHIERVMTQKTRSSATPHHSRHSFLLVKTTTLCQTLSQM